MYKRGFKTWCEEIALKLRRQDELQPTDPLDPKNLAAELDVCLRTPSELSTLPPDVARRLLTQHSASWSAVTILGAKRPLLVYNPAHSPARTSNDLMHELAHILLNHRPTLVFIAPHSRLALRTYDKDQEDEANWLAGCLLLPRPVLLHVRRSNLGHPEACELYGVSSALLTYRLNVTGVNLQFTRIKGRAI